MDYQRKYLKYKSKYLKLKMQFGGAYLYLKDDNNNSFIIETKQDSIDLGLKLSKVTHDKISAERIKEIIDLLENSENQSLFLTSEELNLLRSLMQSVPNPVTTVPDDDSSDDSSDDEHPVPIKTKIPIKGGPSSKPSERADTSSSIVELINKQEGALKLLKKFGLDLGYLSDNLLWREIRIKEISDYFKKFKGTDLSFQEASEIFESEKKTSIESLKRFDDKLKRTHMSILYDSSYKPSGIDGHHLVGTYEIGASEFIFKEFDICSKELVLSDFPEKLQKAIEFIEKCRQIYFDIKLGKTTIKFVPVESKLILTNKDSSTVSVGYLMQKAKGITVREFRKMNEDVYQRKILPAIDALIKELSRKGFVVIDFALDNVMWDNETETLTYIDVSPESFVGSPEKATHINRDLEGMSFY